MVENVPNGPDVLYIDKHFIHEVTSPQAFAGLDQRGIKVLRPERTVATADHNVPTANQHLPIQEALSRKQVQTLENNCERHGIELYGLNHPYQGIVHVIGPELGITQPGRTIVCGDSHTSTHGAFGALAFGIGTSEVEMVLASQCVLQARPKTMEIRVEGDLPEGTTAKDIILYVISRQTTSGGTGHFVEYAGSAVRGLSMEGRMTICNMSIEMGARGGMIAPDQITFDYIKGRLFAPKCEDFKEARRSWEKLVSDPGAPFDKTFTYEASDISPMITYGTNPGMGMKITDRIPDLGKAGEKAMAYMDLRPGEQLLGKKIRYVFMGSCTNARIEDFRAIADIVKGKQKAPHVNAYLIPGSNQVLKQIQEEGIEEILESAGFEVRQPGCSACLGMNEDKVPPGEYCVSTSNRNFEGRQGPGARTFLVSPGTAAATAIAGKITDIHHL